MAATRLISSLDLGLNPDPRPTLMVFGNSLAGQANASLQLSTTTTTASAAPGSTSLTVGSSSSFSAGAKIAVALYTGEFFTTTVASVTDSTHIVTTDKMPKMIRASASILVFTTARVPHIRQGLGTVAAANALLGNPLRIIQGYGYGGGLGSGMLPDLALWLKRIRPNFVYLQLLENDIPSNVSLVTLQRLVRAAVRLCLAAGARPIVTTPYPSTSYTAGAQVAVFDAIKAYILNDLAVLFPAMIPLSMSDAWVDTSQPTLRTPLAGWTDGVIHPIAQKYWTVGSLIASQIASAMPAVRAAGEFADAAIHDNALMTGTGGANSGAGTVTGAPPDGWTVTVPSGVTLTHGRAASGNYRMQMSVAGASDVSGTQVTVSRTITLPAPMQGGQLLKGFVIAKMNALSNLAMFYPQIAFSDGSPYSAGQDNPSASDPALVGNTIMIETTDVPVPEGCTAVTMSLNIRPQTLASPSGVAADIEIVACGVIPGDRAVRDGIVLP